MRNQEDQAERRLRKVNDIKAMFWKRLAEENKKPQNARGAVGRAVGLTKNL